MRLRRDKKYIFVGHERPDTDCIVAMVLFARALGLPVKCSQIEIRFMPPGRRFTGRVPPNTLVAHFDTGGICNPQTLDFDHHMEDCKYRSATEMVFQHCYEPDKRNLPGFLHDLVAYVNDVDDPAGRTITSQHYKMIKHANALLDTAIGPDEDGHRQIVFGLKRRGPADLARIINNFNPVIEEEVRVVMVWAILDAWFRSFENRYQINTFITEEHMLQRKNGINFAKLPPNLWDTKLLRNCVNAWWQDRIDVLVSQQYNKNSKSKGVIGITIIGEVGDIVGMQELQLRLYEEFPSLRPAKSDVFMHDTGFVIYIKPRDGVTLDKVFQLALDHLRSEAETTGETKALPQVKEDELDDTYLNELEGNGDSYMAAATEAA
jgi:hypothetical protein